MPFLKIVIDLFRGIPANSILYSGIDPYSLPPKHQTLSVGLGFLEWGPTFSTVFTTKDLSGSEYPISLGDYGLLWIQRTFGPEIPVIFVTAIVTVSMFLVVRRIISAIRFERMRKNARKGAPTLRTAKVDWRVVDIYTTKEFSGTPFTGGLFKPYVCIPEDALKTLASDEIEAVIAHELAHVKYFDLLVTGAIQFLGDIFWFIPGYRFLSRKIDRLREILADQYAAATGVGPELLASALVKLKHIPETNDKFILYSAFFRERSLLKERVTRLLSGEQKSHERFGWQSPWGRSLIVFWTTGAVVIATFGGNHQLSTNENPAWINKLAEWLSSMVN